MLQSINVLVQDCCLISKLLNASNTNLRDIPLEINEKTSVFEIAAATSLQSAGNRCISINLKARDGQPQIYASTIQCTCPFMEPLCYPLLFPYGEEGWGSELRGTVHFSNYLASRFLMPDKNEDATILKTATADGKKLFPSTDFNYYLA